MNDRIEFRIAVIMYCCLHGTAPEYLTCHLEDLCILYGLPVAISSSFRLLNCLHLEDVPLMCLAQLFGTIFVHISETLHSHLTRSDDISKHTILHVINFPATL